MRNAEVPSQTLKRHYTFSDFRLQHSYFKFSS
jgi:hypothetical protein